jgi:hypothetical protein
MLVNFTIAEISMSRGTSTIQRFVPHTEHLLNRIPRAHDSSSMVGFATERTTFDEAIISAFPSQRPLKETFYFYF